jgi:hypothetical protein
MFHNLGGFMLKFLLSFSRRESGVHFDRFFSFVDLVVRILELIFPRSDCGSSDILGEGVFFGKELVEALALGVDNLGVIFLCFENFCNLFNDAFAYIHWVVCMVFEVMKIIFHGLL